MNPNRHRSVRVEYIRPDRLFDQAVIGIVHDEAVDRITTISTVADGTGTATEIIGMFLSLFFVDFYHLFFLSVI